ncbi:O-succinylhomoserine sulfhydrylase [Paracoccaceae bacterium GXU_MW_L88]
MAKEWKSRTKAVHKGTRRSQYAELSEAMFLTQGFVYPDAETAEQRFIESGREEFIYARYGNPTMAMFEDRIAAIEGAEAGFATASGMAAVNGAVFSQLQAGDHVVSARALFGSCLFIIDTLLPTFGIEITLVDGTDLEAWKNAVKPNTKMFFCEAMSNPCLEVIDIQAVADIAHEANAIFVVDNVFATPVLQKSIDLGADLVVYSATKHIDGQGRMLGGVILGKEEVVRGPVEMYLKHTGGAMNPFTAWVMLKGLETLDLRVNAQADSALAIAEALDGHDKVKNLIYPGLASHPQYEIAKKQMTKGGTMLALDLGSKEAAFTVMNALEIILISNNLGDAKSIITHPATTTHQRLSPEQRAELGITDGLLRLSVGLEDAEDLIADFRQALDRV